MAHARKMGIALLTVSISAVACADLSFGFLPLGPLAAILAASMFGIAAVGFAITKRWTRCGFMTLLVAACVAGIPLGTSIVGLQERKTMALGDAIVSEINAAYVTTSKIPEKLPRENLDTAMGLIRRVPFHYRVTDGDFELSFSTDRFGYCFRSRTEGWYCDR